jgi:phosphoribosylanthranilate isomerase
VRVKICGITSFEDAAAAVALGADALGFNFHPESPRYIDPANARGIIRRLPPFAAAVGVFVNPASPEEVVQTARLAGVGIIQLHGDESPEFCGALEDFLLIKAVRVGAELDPAALARYPVRAFLLDAYEETAFGGTGRTFNWELAAAVTGMGAIILAGGLTPENVGRAIRTVRPYAVDVCSGVEAARGRKDRRMMARFMDEVHNAAV